MADPETQDQTWIITAPTGARALQTTNEGGWGLAEGSDSTAPRNTDAAAPLAEEPAPPVNARPLIPGKNICFTWGESKATGINYQATAYAQILAAAGGSLPSGATIGWNGHFHGGQTMADLVALASEFRATMDAAFAGGAEAVSFISLQGQANDMIAFTSPAAWEKNVDTYIDLIRRYALQKYVGTDPAQPIPDPPAYMTLDCSFAYGDGGPLSADIPLLSVEKARRDGLFGLAAPDYICAYNAPDYRHYNAPDKLLISAYHGLAWYWWRALGKKYAPTQVVEWWLQGNDFFLRCEMPHAPLVADTALVSAIAQNGLKAFTVDGEVAISDLAIIGGGTIIRGTTASPLVGGRIEGGLSPTTALRSGKVDGPRLMYRDSSPYVVDLGGGDVRTLYSPLLPFRVYFEGAA